ncbi:MAG: RDD family protein [Planctomycetota bacterium]|jgi:uncharacterized RDD family membrane protein YckC|nr:RDD family protein [Planctomycetota bacterium]
MDNSDSSLQVWYFACDGKQDGPISEEQLLDYHRQRKLRDDDLVWAEGMRDWKPLGEVLKKIMRVEPVKPQPPQVPQNPNMSVVTNSDEQGVASHPLSQPRSATQQVNSQNAWKRFVARMFDSVCYVIIGGILMAVFMTEEQLEQAVGTFSGMSGYSFVLMLSLGLIEAAFISKWGMTPGKWVMRIRVVHKDQRFLSYFEALKRTLFVFVRGMGLGLFPLNVIFNALSYVEVTQTGNAIWDKRLGIEVQHAQMHIQHKVCSTILAVVMTLLILALLG